MTIYIYKSLRPRTRTQLGISCAALELFVTLILRLSRVRAVSEVVVDPAVGLLVSGRAKPLLCLNFTCDGYCAGGALIAIEDRRYQVLKY